MSAKGKSATRLNLDNLPGYCARRVHQLAVALFAQQMADVNVTPVQYSLLQAICNNPEIDQGTLARTIGLDTSTTGSVVDRLEARELVTRTVSPGDRRVRLLSATAEGEALLAKAIPRMLRSQQLLLQPLSESERTEFLRLMQVLVTSNTELSRASPSARIG